MAHQRKVIISVDTDEPEAVSGIAARLGAIGLEVDDILETLSTITGTCDEAAVSSLQAVPGVVGVETQRTYQLPPPDEPQ